MKFKQILMIAGIFLVGCGSAPVSQALDPTPTQSIPATPTWTSTSEPTNTATPTSTATLVPLSQIDLSAILYQSGDLPETYAVSDIERLGLGTENAVPPADIQNKMTFWIPGTDDTFTVTVFLYESLETVDAAYQIISSGAETGSDFGEKSFILNNSVPEGTYTIFMSQLGFSRCHALVSLAMVSFGWSDPSILEKYAETLDARLGEAVCR